jgi:ATP-dependent Clp protease adaptor protein ClpS
MILDFGQIETLELDEVITTTVEGKKLMIFNDDINTFEHVIETLIEICEHTPDQAEQCAWITHYKGKCTVKEGSFEKLAPMRNGICERGIDAKIVD